MTAVTLGEVNPDSLTLRAVRLDPDLPFPAVACPGDAGVDLYARGGAVLEPGARAVIPTGLAVEIPTGFVGLVHPRSGLAARHGITVLNAPGTVDSGYRGEILVNLYNSDSAVTFEVRRGDRIAQLLVQRVCAVSFEEVPSLSSSVRGVQGHGDSGGFASPAMAGAEKPVE